MNKRILWITGLCVIVGMAAVLFIMMQSRSSESTPVDAKDITVTDIKRVNVNKSINSYLAWVPGQKNSVAAIEEGLSDSDKIYAYDLETGATSELYDLENYGLDRGNSLRFFWSADGKYIVTGSGGVLDLEKKTGHWIKPPVGAKTSDIDVLGISPDGKTLLVDIWGKGVLLMDLNSGQNSLFSMRSDVFSARFGTLARSADGKWIAAQSYDPNHLPKDVIEALDAPQALYLLSINGKEARLIARNIEGRIETATFSPDGNKLVWDEMHTNGDQSIFIANLDGSGAHEIFSNANLPSEYNIASNLLWSPDGTRIVFAGPPDANFKYHLWVLTLGKASPITPTP